VSPDRPFAPPGEPPAPPPAAEAVFADRLPTAVAYVAALAGPGVAHGLLGPREVPRLWDRHVLNSAVVAEAVPAGAAVLDVGSGAGLPGIPLALARPDLTVTLVEPMLRRTRFLDEVVAQLGLAGQVRVLRARAEDVPRSSADVVVARAVKPLAVLAGWTLPLLRPGGRLVALKGSSAEAELAAAAPVLRRLGAGPARIVTLDLGVVQPGARAIVVDAGA
jgi:16S rRNA (guanine527-N7)-methyltransferase